MERVVRKQSLGQFSLFPALDLEESDFHVSRTKPHSNRD